MDIPKDLRLALIPNLALQPIVENAILHGIARKSVPGTVQVTGRREGDTLILEVADDGPGLARGRLDNGHEGIGLANTRERLAKLYGDKGRLTIKSESIQGVVVQIEARCDV